MVDIEEEILLQANLFLVFNQCEISPPTPQPMDYIKILADLFPAIGFLLLYLNKLLAVTIIKTFIPRLHCPQY